MTEDSNAPPNTAFTQQRLPAGRPLLTPYNVIGTFLVTSLIFIPLGVALLLASNSVTEITLRYDDICEDSLGNLCADKIDPLSPGISEFPSCSCQIKFKPEKTIQQPVYLYYKLTNFYQNHFAYQRSVDYAQLSGSVSGFSGNSLDSANLGQFCQPQMSKVVENRVETNVDGTVAPCGAIANTLFNDTFSSPDFEVDRSDISWNTDHNQKYNNPKSDDSCNSEESNVLKPCWENTEYPQAKPSFWKYPIWDVYKITQGDGAIKPTNGENGYKNQLFENWMRVGAFSTVYKLFGVVKNDLESGKEYTFDVGYNYPVNGLDVTKSIVVSTMSWVGGKNSFLGIAYIVVGSLSLVSGLFLFYTYKRMQNKFDM